MLRLAVFDFKYRSKKQVPDQIENESFEMNLHKLDFEYFQLKPKLNTNQFLSINSMHPYITRNQMFSA